MKGVERKSSQGTHAKGHKLCCWETAVPDTPATGLQLYRQAKSPGPQPLPTATATAAAAAAATAAPAASAARLRSAVLRPLTRALLGALGRPLPARDPPAGRIAPRRIRRETA